MKITFEEQLKIKEGIACEEAGYPLSEARFSTVLAWEEHYEKSWKNYVQAVKWGVLYDHRYILDKISEEAAEVAVAANKVKLFSPHHRYQGGPSNLENLKNEVKDLLSCLEVYADILGDPELRFMNDEAYLEYKKDRLLYYSLFASGVGVND